MVILTCFIFAGAEIESAHEFDHIFFHVTIFEFRFVEVRRNPFCFQLKLGETFVHVFDIETADSLIAPSHVEFTVIGEFTQDSGFHIAACGESKEFIQFFRRNSKAHTFLCFGNQDFPGLHTGIFQRSFLQVHTAAVADRCHFPDRGGKTACTVICNKAVQKTAAGFGKEVAHTFLCDRVTDLNRLNRTVFVQFFAGEGGTVDTVFTDTSAGHNDDIARLDVLFPTVLIADLPGNGTDGSAINQGFTNITFIKVFPADGVRNTALVATVDHTFVYTGTETAGMEQTFRHIFLIGERRTEAIPPDVQQQVSTHTGTHWVTVHTDDPGHSTSVGVKCGRRVVCFSFVSDIETVIETDHAGIVCKDGNEPVDLFADFFCTFLDERFVKRNDMFFFLRGDIFIIHSGSKDFVFAVFRPGLSKNFHFHVCGVLAETELFTVFAITEVILNGFHFFQAESPGCLVRKFDQFIIGDFQVEFPYFTFFGSTDFRLIQRNRSFFQFCTGINFDRFDQFVGEKVKTDLFLLFFSQSAFYQIFNRAENLFRFGQFSADNVTDRFMSGTGNVIRYAGTISDGDEIIKFNRINRSLTDQTGLCNRVCQFLSNTFRLFRSDVSTNSEDISCAERFHGMNPENIFNVAEHSFRP